MRQRQFKSCRLPRATISPSGASASSDEFQRIRDHRRLVLVDPLDAVACLQLARAYTLAGDTVKASSAYEELFTLWKNADSDLSMLVQARAEYARLPP